MYLCIFKDLRLVFWQILVPPAASFTKHQPLLLKIAVCNQIFGESLIYKRISQFSIF